MKKFRFVLCLMMAALLFCQFALAEAPDASGDPAVTLVYAEVNNLEDTVVGQVALHFAERVNELTGDVAQYENFFEALKRACPVPIGFEEISSGAKGYYHTADQRIALQEGMSQVQTIKTLIHEMAHQKLHTIDPKDLPPEEPRLTRNAKEVEAESVAYTVAQHYGIETSDYSFAYIAGWSKDKDTPELKASLDRIRKAADEMITAIDEQFLVVQREKEPVAIEGPGKAENSPAEPPKAQEKASVLKELSERKTEARDKNAHENADKNPHKESHKKVHKKKEETR